MTLNDAFDKASQPERVSELEKLLDTLTASKSAKFVVEQLFAHAMIGNPVLASVDMLHMTSFLKVLMAASFEAGRLYGRSQSEAEVLEGMLNL